MMLKQLLGKKKTVTDDVILISPAEIRVLPVEQLSEESVCAGSLTLPVADAEVRYYPSGGRAYIFGYTGNYLAESERITELEKNVALKSMFNYGVAKQLNIPLYATLVILLITILVLHH
ncbi:hypothetical protein CEB3_c17570 [Peptococcaceae bacterium CEB3]|nr:hypothetical protein CEB3_c17570 [Peptococcaceae bacterium CEB3]